MARSNPILPPFRANDDVAASGAGAPPATGDGSGEGAAPFASPSACLIAPGPREWPRRIWERWGLVVLAAGLAVALHPSPPETWDDWRLPVSPLPWLAAFWLVLMGIRTAAEALSGSPRGRWVPRGMSLALGGAILAVGYSVASAGDWLLPPNHPARWDYAAFRAWPVVAGLWMAVHARAVRARTSSALIGWGISALFLFVSHMTFIRIEINYAVWQRVVASGSAAWTGWTVFLPPLAAGSTLAIGWLTIAAPGMAHALAERWFRRRRGIDTSGPSESPATPLLLALMVPALPALLARDSIGMGFRPTDTAGALAQVAAAPLRVLFLAAGVGLAAVLLALVRGRGRRFALAAVLPAALLVAAWELGLVGNGPSFTELARLLWICGAVVIAIEAWAGRAGPRGAGSREEPPRETEALRALFRTLRSPIRYWGSGAKRRLLRIAPALLFFSILFFIYITFFILYFARNRNAGASLLFPFSGRMGRDYWNVVLFFTVFLGVAAPLALVVPYRWAARFDDVWNPRGLGELWTSLLRPWEIVWAVVVPPVYQWVYCGAWALLASGGVFALLQWGLSGKADRFDFDGLVWPALAAFLLVGTHAFLTLGLLRRRVLAGMAAFGVSAGAIAIAAFGSILAMRGLRAFGTSFMSVSLFTNLPLFAFLFAGRWALASAPESLARAARGE